MNYVAEVGLVGSIRWQLNSNHYDFGDDENPSDLLTRFSGKRKRGRPTSIDLPSLLGRRDRLVWLLENNWGRVGWELFQATTIEQVRSALEPLDREIDFVLKSFTTAAIRNISRIEFREMKKKSVHLHGQIRDALEEEESWKESHEKALRAFRQLHSAKQSLVGRNEERSEFLQTLAELREIAKECRVRRVKLLKKHAHREELEKEERALSKHITEAAAFLAQSELLRFILSVRYTLTPSTFANAMAGFPEIGWRRSSTLCARTASSNSNNTAYQTFQIIRKGVGVESRPVVIEDELKRMLLAAKGSDDFAIQELKKNWYYLKEAVRTACTNEAPKGKLPYRITAEYQTRITYRSALDLLHEEEEHL